MAWLLIEQRICGIPPWNLEIYRIDPVSSFLIVRYLVSTESTSCPPESSPWRSTRDYTENRRAAFRYRVSIVDIKNIPNPLTCPSTRPAGFGSGRHHVCIDLCGVELLNKIGPRTITSTALSTADGFRLITDRVRSGIRSCFVWYPGQPS